MVSAFVWAGLENLEQTGNRILSWLFRNLRGAAGAAKKSLNFKSF